MQDRVATRQASCELAKPQAVVVLEVPHSVSAVQTTSHFAYTWDPAIVCIVPLVTMSVEHQHRRKCLPIARISSALEASLMSTLLKLAAAHDAQK